MECVVIKNRREHRAPWECAFAEEDKSKCAPGISPKSDQEYFEILCLCILQAGLGWGMIRKNWAKFKRGFYGFNIERLAKAKKDELLNRDGVIKNRMKVGAIINNAKKFQKIKQDKGSFSNLLKSLRGMEEQEVIKILTRSGAPSLTFEGGAKKRRSGSSLSPRPELKPRGKPKASGWGVVEGLTHTFAHIGKYSAEYYLHSVGYWD
jgi:3-methyladenine DNA glycosylase Tag